MTVETNSAAETARFAESVSLRAKPGEVYALTGELGAGKTEFARGFARGLGCPGRVASPTFTIMNVYTGGRLAVYHFDLYRLGDAETELEGIGFEDYFYSDGVSIVEWAERAENILPRNSTRVKIEIINESEKRRITVSRGEAQ